jgi:arabinogalactan oligomer / maltooligosaccharide transport system substrate-binding protein
MSRKTLWLILSVFCLSAVICLGVFMVVQAGATQEKSISAPVSAGDTLLLPLITKNYVPPKITIWHQWDPSYWPEYDAIVQEFNMEHPEMAIILVYVDDLSGALSEAIPAGVGPDIVAYANDRIGQWATAGYLAPLDPSINLAYMNANYEPAAVDGVIWNNHIWGIPDFQEGIALVYNRDVISDTQIPAPDDFAGLLTQAELFRDTHSDQYYLCNQGLGGYDAYHVAPIYFGYGLSQFGGYLDEEGTVYMTTTEAISAAQWISDFHPSAPDVTDHGICRDMLVYGAAAMWWTGPWAIPDLQDAGVNYGIAPMGSPFVGVRNYMMTTNAVTRGNSDAVIEILKYFGNADIQKQLTLANKTIPANTAALNDPDVQAIYEVSHFGAALNRGTAMSNHIYTACQWDPVAQATMNIWDGSQTPEMAMDFAQTMIEACVAGFGPSTITIWEQWNDAYLPAYQQIIDEYTAAHPGISINLYNPVDMPAALASYIPYGAGPDIVAYSNDQIGPWAEAGYLVPLNPWIDSGYMNSNFEPAAVKGVTWDDLIMGIPDTQEGIALVYNHDLITDADIPAPDDFSGFFADAVQFQVDNPGVYYLCSQGLGSVDAYHPAPIYFGLGMSEYGGYVDEEGTVYMTTTEAINAANWIFDFSVNGPMSTNYDICKSMLIKGEAAIWWTGPWAIPELQNAGVDYGIAPMGSPFVSVRNYMFTINGYDRGKAEAAIDLMLYLGSAEVQEQLTVANHTVPANTAALNDPDVQAIYEVARFGDSLHLGTPMANHSYGGCQWQPVGDATWAIWSGAQTPLEAMNTAQAAIEACIAGP